MACKHIESASLKPPTLTQHVYREDCTRCFDSIDDPKGLDVCLYCFNGACPAEPNREGHSIQHVQSQNHPLVLNIKRTPKHIVRDEPPLKKLAIAAETETDRYDTTHSIKCYECGVTVEATPKLQEVVDGVLNANTFAKQQEIKSWELDITPCEHTLCLQQEAPKVEAGDGCSQCELKENLWLCLTCGNLGCGREIHGGLGGNAHGVAHNKETGHPVVVKLGSLTAEGADIYCYACDEERSDPELPAHLAHWGINIADRQKTEKSLTEMQIEQNQSWDFSMSGEDGEMKPIFGPGFTGLKNLGNSCYMNSVLQSLFSIPEFIERYNVLDESDTPKPAENLNIQLQKLANGLLSGRYSKPDDTIDDKYQKGLAPSMLKALVGQGHPEFSTMRQQDSFEFLLHLLKLITRSPHTSNPVDAFRFEMEQRLQCISCGKVRYRTDEQENISLPVPAEKEGDEFKTVPLSKCLDAFTASENVELTCPSCKSDAGFTKQSKFATLPTVLAINARRFALINWVPTKQDVPVDVSDAPILFDSYLSAGKQAGEELLPEEAESNDFVPNPEAMMMIESMGFPQNRAIKALHATGNDAEAATMWLMEHMEDPDIDQPLPSSKPKQVDQNSLSMLMSMGFSAPQARQAMQETDGDVERAVDWLFSHPDATGVFESDAVPVSHCRQNIADSQAAKSAGFAEKPAKYQLQSIVCHKGSSIHAG
jgi:ubiquitin carboxyl-terminal hydrolase 5/13